MRSDVCGEMTSVSAVSTFAKWRSTVDVAISTSRKSSRVEEISTTSLTSSAHICSVSESCAGVIKFSLIISAAFDATLNTSFDCSAAAFAPLVTVVAADIAFMHASPSLPISFIIAPRPPADELRSEIIFFFPRKIDAIVPSSYAESAPLCENGRGCSVVPADEARKSESLDFRVLYAARISLSRPRRLLRCGWSRGVALHCSAAPLVRCRDLDLLITVLSDTT